MKLHHFFLALSFAALFGGIAFYDWQWELLKAEVIASGQCKRLLSPVLLALPSFIFLGLAMKYDDSIY